MKNNKYFFKLTFTCGLFNAILGIICYLRPSIYKLNGRYIFIFGILSLFMYLFHYKQVLMFQARILLLSSIGYFAGFVKAINPKLLFSPIQPMSQSFEIGAKMFGLTSIALFGAFIGLTLGFRPKPYLTAKPITHLSDNLKNWHLIYYVSLAIVLLIGYLTALSYGETIFNTIYASGTAKGQALGNLQSIGIVCAILNITASIIINKSKYLFGSVGALAYFFIWGILIRGGRIDILSGLLAIMICIPLVNNKITNLTAKQIFYIFLFAVFMQYWGSLRSTLTVANSESMIDGYRRLAKSGIIFSGTISAIGSTFANVLDMMEHGVLSKIWGMSYLEYILRTPPQFLYPGRPSDYSTIFSKYGYGTCGGFFELAEAYLNFDLFGCFLIPLFISFGLAKIYQKALQTSLFWYLILAAALSVFFRGAWYQSFAFYKSLFTGIIIYTFFLLIDSLGNAYVLRGKSRQNLQLEGNN